MRKKLLAKNTIASLIAQITALVCGFILPRLFLMHFGSEVNGLVNSITQFLSVSSFLELGVGAVVQSSLYQPLADKDYQQVSKVISSANKFFHKLAKILLIYVIVLMIVYPMTVKYGYLYTISLIAATSISSFAQYYFGIVNALLLNADQRGYIQYNAQTITIILNTLMCAVLIQLNTSVQMVKLTTSLIYLMRPLVLWAYVKIRYNIDWKIKYKGEPIKQKWNGVAQHVAAVILDGTDTIVLTIFSTLSNVSIYSVYFLVVKGVKTLLLSMTNGIQSLEGELWAKKEIKNLKEFFGWVEWCIHTATTYVFTCVAILIIPFIKVYTMGVKDANYIQPVFSFVLVLANAMHCLRLPYNLMTLAAGHYKQTQRNYIIAAILNITVSIAVVRIYGLVGVALGTLVAMAYQTVWLAVYNSKHMLCWSIKKVIKQFIIDIITSLIIIGISQIMKMETTTYVSWVILAVKVALMAAIVIIIVNTIAYREKVNKLILKMNNIIHKADKMKK